jgi:hypothetical protein
MPGSSDNDRGLLVGGARWPVIEPKRTTGDKKRPTFKVGRRDIIIVQTAFRIAAGHQPLCWRETVFSYRRQFPQ